MFAKCSNIWFIYQKQNAIDRIVCSDIVSAQLRCICYQRMCSNEQYLSCSFKMMHFDRHVMHCNRRYVFDSLVFESADGAGLHTFVCSVLVFHIRWQQKNRSLSVGCLFEGMLRLVYVSKRKRKSAEDTVCRSIVVEHSCKSW